MAEQLDRVRISAAELRASSCSLEQEDGHVPKKHRRRPDLQRYKRGPGQGRQRRDSKEAENTPSDRRGTPPPDSRDPKPRSGRKTLLAHADDRMRGDGSNVPNINSETAWDKDTPEYHQESQEPAGAAKPERARKPDREFYRPGSRRNAPGKDCGEARELDKTPPRNHDHKAKEREAKGSDEDGKCTQQNAKYKGSNRNEGSRAAGTNTVEKLVSKVEKLSLQGQVSREDCEDAARGKTTHQERREDAQKRASRRRKVSEKEKSQNVIAGQSERENARSEGAKANKSEETHLNKPREITRRSDDANNKNGVSREADRGGPTQRHGERKGQRSERTKSDSVAPASKRYSKSDIRRPRRRTYSSSSAGSTAGPDAANRPDRPQRGARGSRSRGASGGSSADSGEEGETSEPADDGCTRRTHEAREARSRSKGGKGRGPGLLRVSSDKKRAASGDRHKHGPAPRGRGGGILVLPSRSDLAKPPESSQRMLFGGARGGTAPRARGGRGGNARRLWDPNNPEQKPALTAGGRAALPKAVYAQAGYGQLHFLDTDDEVAGCPPVSRQQAAALAYYKFQKSDNPYCCPPPAGQRYPYPLASPYQVAPAHLYRGYAQVGGGLTAEEAEQRARGELGRMLRAADSQEVQLSNLLSRDRLSADGLERMVQLRAELLAVYEHVVLSDIELADSQSVDQALWKNVFYQVIEHFRQLLKDPSDDNPPRVRSVLLTLLDEGAHFFDALLQKLQTVYQFKLEDYMDGMALRARPLRKTVKYALISAQRCLICQGDIARYREQASDSANYGKARSWYLKAQQIAPKNGRPYNQLALLAVYTKRKLDAVYYYMRSLAASNPILTAKESLMSLFEEAKRKTEQLERRRRQDEQDGGSRGPAIRGRAGPEDGARSEVWVRPSGRASDSARDSQQDGELSGLSAGDLHKRFILSFLHAHGKLFTKVGMESFPRVSRRVVQEFRALLQRGPSLLGSTQLLQIITINMFTVHNALTRGGGEEEEEEGGGVECRSVLQEQSTALGLAMFALMVQHCTQMLTDTPAASASTSDVEREDKEGELEALLRVSDFPADLRELLPSIKVWSDWMLGHPDQWNPPPSSIDGSPDVWQCLARLCNVLARVDHGEVPLYKVDTDEVEGEEELMLLQLKEDRLLAGFVPLLAAPQEPCYVDRHTDTAIDCKRVTVLKYFLEALCGQEEPLLAFKGGKYVSVAPPPPSLDAGTGRDSLSDKETDDVIVESSLSEGEEDYEEAAAGDSESDIRELKARRHALTNKLVQQQKRRQKIQAVLQTSGQLQLEVRPLFLVPDTNGFIDHLVALKKLLQCGSYIVVVPLIVITELDGLAKGQDASGGGGGGGPHVAATAHVRGVQEKARQAVLFLERAFEAREPRLRALTSRGTQLESIAFRSEDTSGQQGNNDDVILSCCLHYCQDKAKDFMPNQRNGGTVRLHREVVLLTDDRNLRVKALTRNVPVRDIPAFLSWAKVG